MNAKECTIVVDKGDTDGMDYGTMMATFFGEVSPWHDTKKSAQAALRILRTTGDWPDGRPTYWIEDGRLDNPW